MQIILPLSILFLIGCDGIFNKDHDRPSTAMDTEALAKELTSELGLNGDQENEVYSFIREGERFHPHPASLWELAVHLSETLTEEQLERLLTPPEGTGFHDMSYGLKPEEYERSGPKNEFFIDIVRSMLTEEQLEIFESYLEYRNEQVDILRANLESGDMELDLVMREIKALRSLFRVQLDDLLTDEQKEQLELLMENERPRHPRKGPDSESMERIREAMEDALKLTDEQVTDLEELRVQFEILQEELIAGYLSSDITEAEFRVSFIEMLVVTRESKDVIFTEQQHLIMKIHQALAIRAHRHFFGHRGFGRG
jgi:hypothetical protein